MLRTLLESRWLKRLSHGVPIARVALAAQLLWVARGHLLRLDGAQRRRLLRLLVQTRGRRGSLSSRERAELALLLARLEPRLFFGTAVKRLSPVPLPKRLLYGPRTSAARAALASRL
ncbi:MAG: hypothetical protein H0X28_15355 [Solirubrobacterales bacterium]|nr:hypothetical protein [Solirubrobacterales bacterium]